MMKNDNITKICESIYLEYKYVGKNVYYALKSNCDDTEVIEFFNNNSKNMINDDYLYNFFMMSKGNMIIIDCIYKAVIDGYNDAFGENVEIED